MLDLEQMANESDFTADLIELARHLRAADAPFDPDLLEEITSGLPKDLRAGPRPRPPRSCSSTASPWPSGT